MKVIFSSNSIFYCHLDIEEQVLEDIDGKKLQLKTEPGTQDMKDCFGFDVSLKIKFFLKYNNAFFLSLIG